ncbi:MAG: T9SS type A sorting domain-containing protein, partial [Saprospiraceae bacterium]
DLGGKWDFAGDQYFNGSIDDVRVWNTIRTQEQINAFRNRELSGNEANLVSYFRLNEGIVSGHNTAITTIKDQAGTSDGELLNMAKNSSFSNWVIGAPVIQDASCTAPLPLDFLSFTGTPLAKGNQLRWLVANEYDTEVHLIETSQDGKAFEEIGKVEAGTSSYYQWLHEQPARRAYYRIRTIDLDGSETFSNTILIERETPKTFAIQNVFPVPAQDELNVNFALPTAAQMQLEILNLTGQRITKQIQNLAAGNHQLSLTTNDLSDGTYVLRLVQADGSYVLRKFVIQR